MTVPGTSPYAWPYDGTLDPTRAALVICGTGREWSGRTPLDPTVEGAIRTLRRVAAQVGMLTVLVRHNRPSSRPVEPCIGSTAPVLNPGKGEVEVTAAGVDGFYGSPLDALLHRRGRHQLLLVGRGLETAVHSTLRRANDRGYECLTVADACVALDPGCGEAALSSIEMSGGIFGAVGTSTGVVDALTDDARLTAVVISNAVRTEQEGP